MSEKTNGTTVKTVRKTTKATAAAKPATKKPEKKKNLLVRLYDGAQRTILSIRSTKAGRATIRVVKGAAIGMGLYGSYRLGKKSVKPTVVTIEPVAPEEEPTESAPAEEPEEETELEQEHD